MGKVWRNGKFVLDLDTPIRSDKPKKIYRLRYEIDSECVSAINPENWCKEPKKRRVN